MRTGQLFKFTSVRRRAGRDGRATAGRPLPSVAPPTTGTIIAGVATLILIVLAFVVLIRVTQLPTNVASLVGGLGALALLAAAGVFAYWAYACWSLRYLIQDGALVIECGAIRHIVPLHLIREIRKGYTADPGVIRGISWPGFHVGWADIEGIGRVRFYSNHRRHDEVIYLVLEDGGIAVSLSEERLREEIAQGELSKLEAPQVLRWPMLNAAVWKDRWFFIGLGVALGINVLMLVYAFARYPSLPELLPVQYTPVGTVARIGYRFEVLRVPFFALALWAIDAALAFGLHASERLGAYLCVATGLIVQLCFLIAVLRIFSF